MTKRYRLSKSERQSCKLERKYPENSSGLVMNLNRNFCVYPLARDVRRDVKWHLDDAGVKKIAGLPGNEGIKFLLSAALPDLETRLPSGLDMAVLFLVLAKAQTTKCKIVQFSTMTALMKACGLFNNQANRKRIGAALKLWKRIELHHPFWRHGVRRGRKFKPFFETIRIRGYGITIRLSDDGFELSSIKLKTIPIVIPLPTSAAAQNLILYSWSRPEACLGLGTRSVDIQVQCSKFCEAIGIKHKLYKRTLRYAVKQAQQWLKSYNGILIIDMDSDSDIQRKKSVSAPTYMHIKFTSPPCHEPRLSG